MHRPYLTLSVTLLNITASLPYNRAIAAPLLCSSNPYPMSPTTALTPSGAAKPAPPQPPAASTSCPLTRAMLC